MGCLKSKAATSAADDEQDFTVQELVEVTGNFQAENFIGEGGSATVFKGFSTRLGKDIAIKRIKIEKGLAVIEQFNDEVQLFSGVDHPNLLKILGHVVENNERFLVYEFMERGSLNRYLHAEETQVLSWPLRMKIAAGVAEGLKYMHETINIIHRDLKSDNVLLDETFTAKICDFGLAIASDKTDLPEHTGAAGTFGYSDPAYVTHGNLSYKTDVYTLGVLLLEIITARNPAWVENMNHVSLSVWVKRVTEGLDLENAGSGSSSGDQTMVRNQVSQLADPRLNNEYPIEAFCTMVSLALRCLKVEPRERPSISEVVSTLNGLL